MQPISDHFTNVPAFLTKLWKMVSDPKTDHIICWNSSGNSFIILNQVQFWYELLPLYYKHNNMSSFVRQLNMYGFHKITSTENGPMLDGEKDEVQFLHTYFQKGKPELLKLIKRKVTVSKHVEIGNQLLKGEELSKVLSDVKQLRGKQASVDSQLAAMKQENAVLWRELAVLRQKHTKQQQIVNKLIQFLVSMVHPSNSRMGVGVKRHYPLMLRGTPSKKLKTSKNSNSNKNKNDGPTIHELDNEIELESELEPEVLLTPPDEGDKDIPLVSLKNDVVIYSPSTPSSSIGALSPISNIELTNELINEAETISAEKQNNIDVDSSKIIDPKTESFGTYMFGSCPSSNELLTDAEIPDDPILNILEDNIMHEKKPEMSGTKIFINPSSQDTLLSNLANGSYNLKVLNDTRNIQVPNGTDNSVEVAESQDNNVDSSLTVATKKFDSNNKINNSGDFGSIIDNNQSELDIYKDILHGCGTLDTNTLLGLFNDGALEYGFSFSHDNELPQNPGDPMVSGQEVMTYPMLQLDELLDDTLNDPDIADDILNNDLSQLNTLQISNIEPDFPVEKS